jgi:cobalt/nickel transport system permease protein
MAFQEQNGEGGDCHNAHSAHSILGVENQPRASILAKADPRLKLLILAAWSVYLAVLKRPESAMAGLLGSVVLAYLAGVRAPWPFLKKLLLINSFLIFIWLLLPASYSGRTVFQLGPIAISAEGLALCALLSLKALAITAGALSITSAAGVFEFLSGARALGLPEKLAALAMLMTRYVSVVGQEYARLHLAMRARGFQNRLTFHTLRSYANLCGNLLVRGLDRAERVQAAMLCRGYSGRFFFAKDFSFRRQDALLAGLVLAMAGGVAYLDVR